MQKKIPFKKETAKKAQEEMDCTEGNLQKGAENCSKILRGTTDLKQQQLCSCTK